jgi:hypothetical protein
MPSLYPKESRDDPYDSSMRNLRKAFASPKWHPPRPWRSKEEGRMGAAACVAVGYLPLR